MALVLVGLLTLAFAVLWTVGPNAVARELDHTLRGGHPTHRPARHSGLGVAVDDLVLHGEQGRELARVGTLYLMPAPAWPPILVDVDGLTVTSAGLAALQGFSDAPGSWEAAQAFTRRQYGNFHDLRPSVLLRGVNVQTDGGEFAFDDGWGWVGFEDPMHASLRAAGSRDGKPRYAEVHLEAMQDSATLDLLLTDRAVVTDTNGREVHILVRATAPGWQGFTSL